MATYLIPKKGCLGLEVSNANYGVFLIVSVFLTLSPSCCNALATSVRDLCSDWAHTAGHHDVMTSRAILGQDLC